MKILVSAYACEPGKGSEPGVGWNFSKELSSRHEVTVLTRKNNRGAILGSGEPWIERVKWVFIDPPRWLTFWKRGGRGVQLFYVLWQVAAFCHVKRMLKQETFDRIHHITFGKYWVPSFLPYTGLPVVFGPVGGGERLPPGYFRGLSWSGRLAEVGKSVFSWTVPRLPLFRGAYRRMTHVFCATEQTQRALQKLVNCPTEVIPQSGLSAEELELTAKIAESVQKSKTPLFVTVSRLNHWKAIDLAIMAFADVVKQHPDARLEILGGGPELNRLKRLAGKLGLQGQVVFLGRLPTLEDVYRNIASATALIHPALHEAFGQACLEALALSTPVVCWNWGGPGRIVDETCGSAIAFSGSWGGDLASMKSAMCKFCNRSEAGNELGLAGRLRAEREFTWGELVDRIATRYSVHR